jgi:DNA-binding transcriptional MerR regulator
MATKTKIEKVAKRSKPKRPQKPAHEQALLCTRHQTSLLLGGVSYMTLHRWELEGRLTPVRLSEGGMVFYRKREIERLANGDQ